MLGILWPLKEEPKYSVRHYWGIPRLPHVQKDNKDSSSKRKTHND